VERAVACAVFELGLKQCSPKVGARAGTSRRRAPDTISAQVIRGELARGAPPGAPAADLTTEHIKSHLQKYRQHHEQSRQPFRDHFERCLRAPREPAAPAPAAPSARRQREALGAAVGRCRGVLAGLSAEQARLRRDVDAALAEHRQLTDELEELAAPAPGAAPE
jgi:hypothetical protein